MAAVIMILMKKAEEAASKVTSKMGFETGKNINVGAENIL